MANAFAVDIGASNDGGQLGIALQVAYSGTDVPPGNELAQVWVYFGPTDQPAAIRSAISRAITEDAAMRGFTVPSTNMTIPTFQKG